MTLKPDTRGKQRLENFDRAYALLREALDEGPGALSALEKEGVVQRFEYCFELKPGRRRGYLEAGGFVFTTTTPRQVLKDAYQAKLIRDGQVWIDMLDHRNLLSHTCSPRVFEEAVEAIHTRYLAGIADVRGFLRAEASKS
ncbi:MAG: HI0074 family nucleotidyltransferase substrate-binding subunit [Kiritimatiellia bacterium]